MSWSPTLTCEERCGDTRRTLLSVACNYIPTSRRQRTRNSSWDCKVCNTRTCPPSHLMVHILTAACPCAHAGERGQQLERALRRGLVEAWRGIIDGSATSRSAEARRAAWSEAARTEAGAKAAVPPITLTLTLSLTLTLMRHPHASPSRVTLTPHPHARAYPHTSRAYHLALGALRTSCGFPLIICYIF